MHCAQHIYLQEGPVVFHNGLLTWHDPILCNILQSEVLVGWVHHLKLGPSLNFIYLGVLETQTFHGKLDLRGFQ